MLRPNQRLVLHYPETTLVESQAEFQPRNVIIKSVRDLVEQPLTPRQYLNRPFTQRGRWLIRAYDISLNKNRQFYLANSAEFQTDSQLRIGLYEPGAKKPIEVISRGFGNTKRDRILLAKVLKECSEFIDDPDLAVMVFSDDLVVVSG